MFLSVVQHFPIPGEIPDDPCRSFPDGFSLAAQIRLILPFLIRWFEKFNAWFTARVLMMVFSGNHVQLTVHPEHSKYDFIKS